MKQARRLGLSLTGTGKELARRNYVPGQHGPNNRSKLSEYGLQLAENKTSFHLRWWKIIVTCSYKLQKIKGGILVSTSASFGTSFDNVVYRLGLATTRRRFPSIRKPRSHPC